MVLERFQQFDTSLVSDALDEHDVGGGVITGIPPVHPTHTTVGRATPLTFERVADEPADPTNFPYAMLNALEPESVLVIDGTTPDLSCWGGNAAQLAANADANGVVIDGGYRDVTEIRESEFPVFGRQPTPKTSQRRVEVTSVNEPVTIDDVVVKPGDVIVADATGVVVVPAGAAVRVASTAETLHDEEATIGAKIDEGATVADLEADGHSF